MGAGQAITGSYFADMNFPARYTDLVHIVTITCLAPIACLYTVLLLINTHTTVLLLDPNLLT